MKSLKGLIIMFIISLTTFSLMGCDNSKVAPKKDSLGYEQISAAKAKELMDTNTDYIIIDARTEEEYNSGHIKDAILIPEYEIEKQSESKLPNKNQLILVYCRSGRRSKIASETLVKLGYTNVKEFGGIIDWPYEIVK